MQLRVLRLSFLQDGDVGIGVFPKGEEVFVGGERPDAGGSRTRPLAEETVFKFRRLGSRIEEEICTRRTANVTLGNTASPHARRAEDTSTAPLSAEKSSWQIDESRKTVHGSA